MSSSTPQGPGNQDRPSQNSRRGGRKPNNNKDSKDKRNTNSNSNNNNNKNNNSNAKNNTENKNNNSQSHDPNVHGTYFIHLLQYPFIPTY